MTIKPVVSFALLLSAVILAAPATGEAAESQKGKPPTSEAEMDKSSRPASAPSQPIPKKESQKGKPAAEMDKSSRPASAPTAGSQTAPKSASGMDKSSRPAAEASK